MSTAETLASARPFLTRMVQIEEPRRRSRMAAYRAVGEAIEMSSSWVRKAIGGQGGIGLRRLGLVSIAAAYVRLCERIEDAADNERAEATALLEKAHAIAESNLGLVDRSSRPPSFRKAGPGDAA